MCNSAFPDRLYIVMSSEILNHFSQVSRLCKYMISMDEESSNRKCAVWPCLQPEVFRVVLVNGENASEATEELFVLQC